MRGRHRLRRRLLLPRGQEPAPKPCDSPGYACLPSQLCDTNSIDPLAVPAERSDGCLSLSCLADSDCPPSTFCVNAYCQTALGNCLPPAP
ncbi:MAG: hypothetical protein R3B70_00655 [Polyangiaceae bacterium]